MILTGAGCAFSAGGDLVEFEAALNAGGQMLIVSLRYNTGVQQMLEDLPVPVIAAIYGTAVAGGLEPLLSCDVPITAESARIGDGHTRYGVVPAAGGTGTAERTDSPVTRLRAVLHRAGDRYRSTQGPGPDHEVVPAGN